MKQHAAALAFLKDRVERAQSSSPGLSQRRLAEKLKVSSGTLSEVLAGKRKITPKLARRLSDGLLLDPQDRSEFLAFFKASASEESPIAELSPQRYLELKSDEFQLVSEWEHFAVLNLIQTKGARTDVLWLARRLSLPLPTVERALKRLVRLGYLVKCANSGRLKRQAPPLRSSDGIDNISLRKFHQNMLALADKSLGSTPTELRDMSGMMMAVDPKLLPRARELIRDFQDQLSVLLENSDNRSEVYYLGVNLFPLSHPYSKQGDLI